MSYSSFLDSVIEEQKLVTVPDIYHFIRNIRYGSTGNRDPRQVYLSQVGSCSGKHILLRDLLRHVGYEAEIITMFTWFNRYVPVHVSYPARLKEIAETEQVPDFHHYVRVRMQGQWVKLDATWHDALAAYGFPVNQHWDGQGDTRLAATALEEYTNREELIDFKRSLVVSLPEAQQKLRAEYFALVTDWIANLEDA